MKPCGSCPACTKVQIARDSVIERSPVVDAVMNGRFSRGTAAFGSCSVPASRCCAPLQHCPVISGVGSLQPTTPKLLYDRYRALSVLRLVEPHCREGETRAPRIAASGLSQSANDTAPHQAASSPKGALRRRATSIANSRILTTAARRADGWDTWEMGITHHRFDRSCVLGHPWLRISALRAGHEVMS